MALGEEGKQELDQLMTLWYFYMGTNFITGSEFWCLAQGTAGNINNVLSFIEHRRHVTWQ